MARYRLFSHTSSNGVDWARRIRYYGYRGRYLGENLAVGQFTPSGTFHAWYYSSAHRANMLTWPYRSIGLGLTRGYYNSHWAYYITADFGGSALDRLHRVSLDRVIWVTRSQDTQARHR